MNVVVNLNQNKETGTVNLSFDFKDIKTEEDIQEMDNVIKIAKDAGLIMVKDNKPATPAKGRNLANRLLG